MNLPTFAGMAAAMVVLFASISYVRSILAGQTQPSLVSWGIWTALGFLVLSSSWASGAAQTLWFAAAYFIVPLAIFLLALSRGGNWRFARTDLLCLAGAVLGVVVWRRFNSAPAALYIFIGVDALGAAPTIRKSLRAPFSEDLLAWLLGFAAAAINLLSVTSWVPQLSAYPLYAVALSGTVSATLIVRRATFAAKDAIAQS